MGRGATVSYKQLLADHKWDYVIMATYSQFFPHTGEKKLKILSGKSTAAY